MIRPTRRSALFSTAVLVLAGGLVTRAAAGPAPTSAFTLIFAQALADVNGTTAPSGVLRPFEQTFIVQTLENSRNEAELSALAVSQARSSEVRDLAQQLVADYRQINVAFETLARRKAVAVPLQPTSFSDHYRALAERAGGSFDQSYLNEIAIANTRALQLCEAAVAQAKDADVRDLAGTYLPVIRDHVNKTSELAKRL